MMSKHIRVNVICDGQFGSTGKGLLAGVLAQSEAPEALATAWGPNAGHTYVDNKGRRYVHKMLANGIVSHRFKALFIGPGTVLDIDTLIDEIKGSIDHFIGNSAKVFIHENAMVWNKRHSELEFSDKDRIGIGSTKKGVGTAVIEKIQRPVGKPILAGQMKDFLMSMFKSAFYSVSDFGVGNFKVVKAVDWMNQVMRYDSLQIEGAQGFSLGVNSGIYPYVTSRECTPCQILSDCAMPYFNDISVYGSIRTFPIRVANRYDETGKMVGFSGPGYVDQKEILWSDFGMEPELTTVTKLPRRIFTFSQMQLYHFMNTVRPDFLFLNFCNYATKKQIDSIVDAVVVNNRKIGINTVIMFYGYGPSLVDVYGRRCSGLERG